MRGVSLLLLRDFKKGMKEQSVVIDQCREHLDHDLFKIKELEIRVIMAEARSMRDNFIFSKIPEEGINEDPEKQVREIINFIFKDSPHQRRRPLRESGAPQTR